MRGPFGAQELWLPTFLGTNQQAIATGHSWKLEMAWGLGLATKTKGLKGLNVELK